MTQRVFVDANILRSKTLRDWLYFLRVSLGGSFQTHTTEDVLTEVFYHLRKDYPRVPDAAMETWRTQLRASVIQEVIHGFDGETPFSGTDEGDYHVHAAAVHARADILLSDNAPSDFATEPTPYEVMAADSFFCLVAASASPAQLQGIVREQLSYWSRQPTHCQLDAALEAAGCPTFARIVRASLQKLA